MLVEAQRAKRPWAYGPPRPCMHRPPASRVSRRCVFAFEELRVEDFAASCLAGDLKCRVFRLLVLVDAQRVMCPWAYGAPRLSISLRHCLPWGLVSYAGGPYKTVKASLGPYKIAKASFWP